MSISKPKHFSSKAHKIDNRNKLKQKTAKQQRLASFSMGMSCSVLILGQGNKDAVDPLLHLILDNSRFSMTTKVSKIWLAGITAAKKLVVQRWLPPHELLVKH